MNRRGRLGSFVLLALAAAVVLRPWEQLTRPEAGPASAMAYVVRAVDGDTIEVRLDGGLEDVRYIGVLSRLSPHPARRRPPLRLPAVASGVKERLVGRGT